VAGSGTGAEPDGAAGADALFDRSFLPPARFELLVLSDTHYLLHPELQGGEWSSVRQFPARAERALRLAGALRADVVVHLGDVTHEYPETGEAVRSRRGAQAQFERYGLRPYVAPGNMDIGDKPDPTSPAAWVTEETLAGWEAVFGPSWLSFDAHGVHGVVLNSNIMGGTLPQAEAQRRWLEADLEAHRGQRLFLFLHHPPYFVDPAERAWGMYNSLDEPARGWLLGLVRRYAVELLFAGHTHFVSLNRLEGTRLFAAPSTTTSRAGLPEAFTVLPEDRGRSDLPKLGFYLVRDTAGAGPAAGAGGAAAGRGPSVALIRTALDSPALDPADPRRRLLTPPAADLPASRLGVVATHPLGHATPGPVVWPSVVRQPVRDDWRLVALTELGARRVRVPESDLDDAVQRDRLAVLRGEGVAVVASWLWSPRAALPAAVAARRDALDEAEVVYPGDVLPDPACLAEIGALRSRGVPVALSAVIRATPVPPQYHGRTRSGFLVAELAGLDAWLGRHACRVDRVTCRLPEGVRAWDVVRDLRTLGPLANAGAVDLSLDLPFQDEPSHATAVAEALFAAAALPDARLWLSPLIDLDRSMDVALGLLDRLSNPRPAFDAARILNTVLFAHPRPVAEVFDPAAGEEGHAGGGRLLGLRGAGRRLWLYLPAGGAGPPAPPTPPATGAFETGAGERLVCFDLLAGTSETVADAAAVWPALARAAGPALVEARPAARGGPDGRPRTS
jgi:predicted phosphodiesterase